MKAMSREFTTKEKVLLVLLVVIILALAYYRFLHIPCKEAIEAAHAQRDAYQQDLTAALAKENQLLDMKKELDSLGELGMASRMESYNNSKAELTKLNNILEDANSYSIDFQNVRKNGDQIRRDFTLSFQTDTFEDAKKIISELTDCEYRCRLGNMSYNLSYQQLKDNTGKVIRTIDGEDFYQRINVKTSGTFYETMYGGTPDDGLPANEK